MRKLFPFRFYVSYKELDHFTNDCKESNYITDLVSMVYHIVRPEDNNKQYLVCNDPKLYEPLQQSGINHQFYSNSFSATDKLETKHLLDQVSDGKSAIYLVINEQKRLLEDLSASTAYEYDDEVWYCDYSKKYQETDYHISTQYQCQMLFALINQIKSDGNLELVKIYHYQKALIWRFRYVELVQMTKYHDLINFCHLYYGLPFKQDYSQLALIDGRKILQDYYQKKVITISHDTVRYLSNTIMPPLQNSEEIVTNIKSIWELFEKKTFTATQLRALALRYPLAPFDKWNKCLEKLLQYYQTKLEERNLGSREHTRHHIDTNHDTHDEDHTIATTDTAHALFKNGENYTISKESVTQVLVRFYSRYWSYDYDSIFLLWCLYQVQTWFRYSKTGDSKTGYSKTGYSKLYPNLLILDQTSQIIKIPYTDIFDWSLFYYQVDYNYPKSSHPTIELDVKKHQLAINMDLPYLDLSERVFYQFGSDHFPVDLEGNRVHFDLIIDEAKELSHTRLKRWLDSLKTEGYLIIRTLNEKTEMVRERVSEFDCLTEINYLKVDPRLSNLGINNLFLLFQKIE